MKNINLIKKNNKANGKFERSCMLQNGVELRVTRGGSGISVSANYAKQLEVFRNLHSAEEVAYIENYLRCKYDGVEQDDLPLLAA